MSRVVHLHIGAPKTGTTYVQDRLSINQEALAEHGVIYPGRGPDPSVSHFRAALDLLDQDWGGASGHAHGAWDQLARKVRRSRGNVIISHEILAPAPPEKVARVMHDIRGSDVHIVYSVRDLGRQLPAAWQESVKQGRRWTFAKFLDAARDGHAWFARAFDLPRVLNTWGRNLSPSQIHLVTVPRVNNPDEELLWKRFCQALDIDPAWAPADSTRSNTSLGIVETQLIRRLNRRMGRATRREAPYDELIRQMLDSQELLSRASRKVTLPPDRYDWATEQAELWIDWIEGSKVDVIGDVKELLPHRPPADVVWVDPDRVAARPLLNAALQALEAMTREAASRPDPDRQLVGRVRRKLGFEG